MRIGAVDVFKDNVGTNKLAVNKHAHLRTEHVGMKHRMVRDACDAGKVRVVYLRMEDKHETFSQVVLQAYEDSPQYGVMLFKCWGML